jgi:DNA-binding response OmpR family regulator
MGMPKPSGSKKDREGIVWIYQNGRETPLLKQLLKTGGYHVVDRPPTRADGSIVALICHHQAGASADGLNLAIEGLRASGGHLATIPIVLLSFDGDSRLRKLSQAHYGADLLESLHIHHVRLPVLNEHLIQQIEAARRVPQLSASEIGRLVASVKDKLARQALADFIHDCRGVPQTAQGWNRIARELFPKLEREVQRWETPKVALLKAERARLGNIIKLRWKETESPFGKLFALFQKMEGQERSVPKTPLATVKPGQSLGWTTTVLVIEDDKAYAASIAQVLTKAGHRMVLYTDPKKQPQMLVTKVIHTKAANKAEVVLLDLNFGSTDKGYALLRALRASDPTTKIIMLTGHGGEAIIEAKKLGADGYLIKPVAEATLLAEIGRVLARKRIAIVDDELSAVVTDDFQRRCHERRCATVGYEDPDRFLSDLQGGSSDLKEVDLLLLDLMFGANMRGLDLLKSVKQSRGDIPVFMLTGRGDNDTRLKVVFGEGAQYFSGRDGYLVKPLGEEGWAKIWDALFPSAGYTLTLSKTDLCLKLQKPGVPALAPVKLQPRQWILLYTLALKRNRGRAGLISDNAKSDVELNEAQAGGVHESTFNSDWTPQLIAEIRTRIHRALKPLLGDIEIISHARNQPYTLSSLIQQVDIIE